MKKTRKTVKTKVFGDHKCCCYILSSKIIKIVYLLYKIAFITNKLNNASIRFLSTIQVNVVFSNRIKWPAQ